MGKYASFTALTKEVCALCVSVHVHICVNPYILRSCDVECIRDRKEKRKLICSWQLLACGNWPVACDWEAVRWKTAV